MKALLLFSHGSVLCGSERTLEDLAARLREKGAAPIVEMGFLNYSTPLFDAAFEKCVQQGATEITVVPYFLVAGKFVKVDLPRAIQMQREQYPGVEVKIAEAMRFHESLADAVISCAGRPNPPAAWRDILQLAPEFCRASDACPLYGTPRCPCSAVMERPAPGVTTASAAISAANSSFIPHPSSLLLMAHGSPRPESNEDLYRVADEVQSRGVFSQVAVGFMECNQPDIPAAIDELAGGGAANIVAVPYFLHPGNHVADDLPTLLEEAQQKYPAIQFTMGDYLGLDAALETVIMDRAADAV